ERSADQSGQPGQADRVDADARAGPGDAGDQREVGDEAVHHPEDGRAQPSAADVAVLVVDLRGVALGQRRLDPFDVSTASSDWPSGRAGASDSPAARSGSSAGSSGSAGGSAPSSAAASFAPAGTFSSVSPGGDSSDSSWTASAVASAWARA